MKLITELTENVKCVTESREDGKKNLFIEGVFMQYDTPNRNGRVYPRSIMEKEVNRYIKDSVEKKCAYGELNHPDGPQINLDRVSHIIESLNFDRDGKVFGRAKIVNTPMGNIVSGLLEGGANLGVSTRGLGSLKEGKNGIMEVQDDFRLITAADVVADPSAPAAYVKGIMENAEWLFNEQTGEWVQCEQKKFKKMSKSQIEENMLISFNNFLKTL